MKRIGFLACLVLAYSVIDVDGILLKHLTPRPGGIIDTLTKPKLPSVFQLGSHVGGGISFGLGPFGFNLGFKKEYSPGGGHQPSKDPHVPEGDTGYPEGNPFIPGEKPGYPGENPYPGGNPFIPRPKPVIPLNPETKPKPGASWEDEEDEKVPYNPPSKERDPSKPESYEDTSSPKREDKDSRPDWEDIGEVYEKDTKGENYMDADFVEGGLIQPRLNKKRSKRFIESKIYHVPLLFQSNAKPSRVKIHNSLNSLMKVSLKK